MTVSVSIIYINGKDDDDYPLSVNRVTQHCWIPLAVNLGCEYLQYINHLTISNCQALSEFIKELRCIESFLEQENERPFGIKISEDDKSYMLRRLSEILPSLQKASDNWSSIKEINVG